MKKIAPVYIVAGNTTLLILLLITLLPSCNIKNGNHLAKASSSYLREHADNPVNWHEWGEEALELAKKENKPLLISIGYSACHWCHVMEQESFMDTAVARIMNDNFVCIKVDREEHPDIDGIYSGACKLISGSSGWPLNAFALPDGKPFFAGTYYSKQSWVSLLKQIGVAYRTQNNKVTLQANALAVGIPDIEFSLLTDSAAATDKKTYQALFNNVYQKMDLSFGGLKGAPKFPSPSVIEFLLQYHYLANDTKALEAANLTLTQMGLGGIYDQIGGGFARYTTDSLWHIPHFEKMLYDNAQLISVYAHAYQVTGNAFFKTIAQQTIDFVERELRNSGGGYQSSLNADTNEGEGAYYVWETGALKKILSTDYLMISKYFNISEDGNWKEKKNVLFSSTTAIDFAKKNNIDTVYFSKQISSVRKTLSTERNRREKPTVDNKMLVSWNALMIKAYADAYAAFGDNYYLETALKTARFLEEKMKKQNGGLWRSYAGGKASVNAFLDDYAFLAKAYIRLYQITFDPYWLLHSRQLTDFAIKDFYDSLSNMFFYSPNRADSLTNKKIDIADNVIPSSNSTMAEILYTLGIYYENKDYLNKSSQLLAKMSQQLMSENTDQYVNWCMLAGLQSYDINEVVVIGSAAITRNIELQRYYLPNCFFMGSVAEENLPLLKGKKRDNQTMIYVCTNKTCQLPVQESKYALNQLQKARENAQAKIN